MEEAKPDTQCAYRLVKSKRKGERCNKYGAHQLEGQRYCLVHFRLVQTSAAKQQKEALNQKPPVEEDHAITKPVEIPKVVGVKRKPFREPSDTDSSSESDTDSDDSDEIVDFGSGPVSFKTMEKLALNMLRDKNSLGRIK